jgi:hypothetical protein
MENAFFIATARRMVVAEVTKFVRDCIMTRCGLDFSASFQAVLAAGLSGSSIAGSMPRPRGLADTLHQEVWSIRKSSGDACISRSENLFVYRRQS